MSEALKPCPFCGGEAEMLDLGKGTGGWLVVCKGSSDCDAHVTGGAAPPGLDSNEIYATRKTQAISRWNTRVSVDKWSLIARQELAEKIVRYFAGYSFNKHELVQCLGLVDVLIADKAISPYSAHPTQPAVTQETLDKVREALETIFHMGISQPEAMNVPDEQWLYRLISIMQRTAKEAEALLPRRDGGV
jgi:hypothetical protein